MVCTVIAAFTCTPMGRCWERGIGSITILLQHPAIRHTTQPSTETIGEGVRRKDHEK